MPSRDENRSEPRVNRRNLRRGLRYLTAADPDLAAILERHGAPPLWDRAPGFPTLVHIVLEQQVSLASARAAFDRLHSAASPLTPAAFLALDDEELKAIGFSSQKAAYCRGIAVAIGAGALDLWGLEKESTGTARRRLLALRGVGPWTADVYLLMVLGRRDVWPVGDLALAEAVRSIKGLDRRPGPEELEALAEPWRPWRSVAARLLWHHYLEGKANGSGP